MGYSQAGIYSTVGIVGILSLLVVGVHSGSHTLRYHFTTILPSNTGLPQYSIIGFVDDIQISRYDSETRRAKPVHKWMEERIDHKHWDEQTNLAHIYEYRHQKRANELQRHFNVTKSQDGIFTYQIKLACELNEDNTISGYEEFGIDGNEFILFDKDRLEFIPIRQEALFLTQTWNRDKFTARRHQRHIEQECIRWIKKYFHCGKEELQRKVRPEVNVYSYQLDGGTKLICWVYGFYPRDVDVKWVKNGVDDIYSEEAKQILPNPDGTFQIKVTVEVTPQESDSYACHVDHESFNETLFKVFFETESHDASRSNHMHTLPIVAAFGVVVVVIVWYV
ncbi:major histocompatibility complex class I-related gene protein-like [Discoglossus pictus]